MRLWQKLAIAMSAVALIPLSVVAVQAWELTGTQAESARMAARERECVATAQEIGRWVQLKAQAVAGWTHLYPDLASRPPELQTGLLRSVYRAVPGVVTVALLDPEGLLDGPSGPLAPVWLDASLPGDDPLASRTRGSPDRAQTFLEHVALPSSSGEVRLGRPFQPPVLSAGADLPEPAVSLAARSPFGDQAVLAVDLALEEVALLLADRAVGERSWAVYTERGDRVLAQGPAPDGELLRPLLGQRQGSLELSDAGRVGALASVPGVPWTVVLTEPIRPDPIWLALRTRLAIAFGVGLVLALLSALVVARAVSAPVAALRDAARRVASGELGYRVRDDRGDELGELGRAFNEMASQLASTLDEVIARRAQVEEANRALEGRVIERTRELERAQADLVRAGQLAAVAEVGAGLAHDLNNPLASILGVLQVLQQRSIDDASKALLIQAEREAQRCREVAGIMLRLAEPDPTESQVPTAELKTALVDAVTLARGSVRHRGVAIALVDPPEGVELAVQVSELRHALSQLIEALSAGLPSGSSITIQATTTADQVRVSCAPSQAVGVGEARDSFLSMGLGLWVARGVLDTRGGALLSPTQEDGPWVIVLPLR